MTDTVLGQRKYNQSAEIASEGKGKVYLDFSFREFLWPLIFMVSCSLIGLRFPLGYILIPLVFLNRWKRDRYDLIIQFTIFSGGYSLFLSTIDLFIPYEKLLFLASIILMVVYKKNAIEKKVVLWAVAYIVFLLIFARLSEIAILTQFPVIIIWASMYFFIFPLVLYGKNEFNMKDFIRHLYPYLFIFCLFYVIDSFVLSGHFFTPRDATTVYYGTNITFLNLSLNPFSFNFIRIWPQGLFIIFICIYGLIHYYKLRMWQILLIVCALFVTRTFTLYVALLLTWIIVMPGRLKKLLLFLAGLGVFFIMYLIDSEPVEQPDGSYQSTLRVKSTISQFDLLKDLNDEEELEKFGSSRMVTIIPALEIINSLDREAIGVGFLGSLEKTPSKYHVVNTSLEDEDMREMVMTRVEVAPIRVFLTIGYIGLILHCAFFIVLWLMVRKLKYSVFFGTPLIGFVLMGISGFSGLLEAWSLYMCSLALAAVLLANRKDFSDEKKKVRKELASGM